MLESYRCSVPGCPATHAERVKIGERWLRRCSYHQPTEELGDIKDYKVAQHEEVLGDKWQEAEDAERKRKENW